jgi:hypothetical protein
MGQLVQMVQEMEETAVYSLELVEGKVQLERGKNKGANISGEGYR